MSYWEAKITAKAIVVLVVVGGVAIFMIVGFTYIAVTDKRWRREHLPEIITVAVMISGSVAAYFLLR